MRRRRKTDKLGGMIRCALIFKKIRTRVEKIPRIGLENVDNPGTLIKLIPGRLIRVVPAVSASRPELHVMTLSLLTRYEG